MSTRRISYRGAIRWLVALMLCCPMSWAAATVMQVYQWREADGVPAFSFSPPPDAIGHYTIGEITSRAPEVETPAHSQVQQVQQARDHVLLAEEAPNFDLAVAQDAAILAQARDAQQLGRTPLPDERVRGEQGNSRLTPAYFARQARLDTAVALAQAGLDNALRSSDGQRQWQAQEHRP